MYAPSAVTRARMTTARLTCRAAPGRVAREVRGRLVDRAALGRPGAAPALAGADALLERLDLGDLVEQRLERAVDVREQVHVDARAARAAERVVQARVAEVVEPAGEVRRVRARGRELGRRAGERLRRRRERALAGGAVARAGRGRDVAQRLGRLLRASGVDGVLAADQAAERAARPRVERVEELVEVDRGGRLALADHAVGRIVAVSVPGGSWRSM